MDYLLSGLGGRLDQPVVNRLSNVDLAAAVRCARRVLLANPDCESIEIFSRGRFVQEVERPSQVQRALASDATARH